MNTLILQYILGEPEWAGVLGDSDLRGITPLFTSNMSSTPTVDLPSDTPAPKQRLRSDSDRREPPPNTIVSTGNCIGVRLCP